MNVSARKRAIQSAHFYNRNAVLERLVNNGTLKTQRVGHCHILDIGDQLATETVNDNQEEMKKAVADAVEEAEQRHLREMRAALAQLRQQLHREHQEKLQQQKAEFDARAKRTEARLEADQQQRIRDLKREMEKEKKAEMAALLRNCEDLREQAVRKACAQLRAELREEHLREQKAAIKAALQQQSVEFEHKLQEALKEARARCRSEADREAARVAKQHAEELRRQQAKYAHLLARYTREHEHRMRLQNDFQALQSDYQQFMDNTDGRFHSDYLMVLRRHGDPIANRRISEISGPDVYKGPT